MPREIRVDENGIHVVFEVEDDGDFKLLHFSAVEMDRKDIVERCLTPGFSFIEINVDGYDRPYERHGNKYIVTVPGYRMKYVSMDDARNDTGRLLTIVTQDEETGLVVTSTWQFYDGLPIVRMQHTAENKSAETRTVNYISTFNLTGIEKEGLTPQDEKLRILIPRNGWQHELNWKEYSLRDLGMDLVQPKEEQRSSNYLHVSNTGNWSAKEFLPMGYLENTEAGTSLYWQIEQNGSWEWEIGDQDGHLYLSLGGPNELYSHWFVDLQPGQSFTTVPAAVGVSLGGFDGSMAALTRYRRKIRRPNEDNEKLRVIFNDYMNCLFAEPTTEKEIPLIDEAARAGAEYYCIDAGWYAAGWWWDSVGEWKESKERFPNGLHEVTDYIRSKGMIPGLWLELEVMGIHCQKAAEVPDDWFFVRHGKRVFDRSRYQLDYRNPDVRQYATDTIDRLIRDYGIGYIKMDYNIEPGIGTELAADSVGEGLLEHERAYLAWLEGIFRKYPDLVIENCSSGGLRMDYAMLSRYSIQSTSDETDYKLYATIAANSPSALTPEQSAIWSYPLPEGDREEVVFNMINAMLLRIHQSGHLNQLSEERKALVKEGLDVYKSYREEIRDAVPFWPLGLSQFEDEWVSLGLLCEKKIYLAVWRREGSSSTCTLPVDYAGEDVRVRCIYPSYDEIACSWSPEMGQLTVCFNRQNMARLYELSWTQ